MTLIEKIRTSKFSSSERHVSKYVLEHIDNIINMTIEDLEKETYSSSATVVRFCKKLGFGGYRDFRLALVKELESEKVKRVNDVDASVPFYSSTTSRHIVQSLASLYQISIESAVSQINPEVLNNAAKKIMDSKRVFIIALGDSGIIGDLFINRMRKLNYYINNLSNNGGISEGIYNVNRDDYVLFLTYSGNNPLFDAAIKVFRKNKIAYGVITGNENSSLLKYCTEAIVYNNKEDYLKISNFYSITAAGFILDCIYSIIYSKNYSYNKQEKSVFDKLKKERDVNPADI